QAPRLIGTTTYLKERSVTGTENIMMAATRATGRTVIYNAAQEQHIANLAALLREMGYAVSGDGTSTIVIEGSDALSSREAAIEIIPDEIEIGTFAVAAAVTHGDIRIEGVGEHDGLLPILSQLEDFGVPFA